MNDMDGFSRRAHGKVRRRRVFTTALLIATISATTPALAGACKLGKMVEFSVFMDNLQPEVSARVNGSEVRFLLDSGAFFSMIDGANAARLHLNLFNAPPGFAVIGVGGKIGVQLTRIEELNLNGIPLHNVEFIVGGNDMGGGKVGLLGRNLLEVADAEYDFAHGVARLISTKDCGDSMLAYWLREGDAYSVIDLVPGEGGHQGLFAKKKAPFVQPIMGTAYVNNVAMSVMFDTGASTSMLSLKAAARAGIKRDSPGVTAAGYGWGIGRSTVANYLAPVSSFKIGDEEIRNTRLRLSEGEIKDVDMLIGADFFLSHHVYVANGQHKLYFSYNGGPVFNLKPVLADAPPAPSDGAAPAAPPAAPAPQNPAEPSAGGGAAPTDSATAQPATPAEVHADAPAADEAARRGQALASRRQFDQALAALTLACQMAPEQPEYAYQRGMVYWQSKQPKLALADFDRAIHLQPNYVAPLLARAEMRIQSGDSPGAAADLGVVGASVAKEDAVRRTLAADYARIDLHPQAIEQYTLWIAAHPADVWLAGALAGRCRARALAGSDLPLALADCNEALKHSVKESPLFAEVSDSRALVQLRLGHYDKSIADFDASLKINAKNAGSLYGRGLAEMRANQAPAGQADMANARALFPKIADSFAKVGLMP
jgi:predicted aspartyl protease